MSQTADNEFYASAQNTQFMPQLLFFAFVWVRYFFSKQHSILEHKSPLQPDIKPQYKNIRSEDGHGTVCQYGIPDVRHLFLSHHYSNPRASGKTLRRSRPKIPLLKARTANRVTISYSHDQLYKSNYLSYTKILKTKQTLRIGEGTILMIKMENRAIDIPQEIVSS